MEPTGNPPRGACRRLLGVKAIGASLAACEAKPNEDRWGCSGRTLWVLDGASQPKGTLCCDFGPERYVDALSTALTEHAPQHRGNLAGLVRAALRVVIDEHRSHHDAGPLPPGPAATLAVARVTPLEVHWLVLGDAGIVAGWPPALIVDERLASIAPLEREQARRSASTQARLRLYEAELRKRNRPGGYWVAADSLQAASMARTGTSEAATPIVLMTDGVHRNIGDGRTWPDAATFLDDLVSAGPDGVLLRLRVDPAAARRSLDDATLLFVDPESPESLAGSATAAAALPA